MSAPVYRNEIIRWLRSGLSARDAAKLTGCSISYAQQVRRSSGIDVPVRHPRQTTLDAAREPVVPSPAFSRERTLAPA